LAGCSAADRDLLGDILDNVGQGHSGGAHGGGAPYEACGNGSAITYDDVYATIASDVAQVDADAQPATRYVSLANEANVLGCGAALDTSRQALAKLLNSLSLDPIASVPFAVDADRTLYRIDLRDYAWDRPIEVNGELFVDVWEAVIASSVYAVEFVGDDANDAKNDTGTRVPVLPNGALGAVASAAPLYYAALGIGEDLDAFIHDELGVDVAANRSDRALVRAGLEGTGLGLQEFLVERHSIEVRTGYVWQIFSDPAGADALLADPLGTPASAERELLFTLPNGLIAHAVADDAGQRIDASELSLDSNELDFRAKVARSYLRLRAGGMTATDSLRQFVSSNQDDFSPEQLEQIFDIYPAAEDLQNQLDADRDVLSGALGAIGIGIGDPDPIGQVLTRFERSLDLAAVAGDLFVAPDFLENNLNLLPPELQVLQGGSINRADFDTLFVESLCILTVVNENTPTPGVCE
jgi:serine/threonine-protein kinase